VTPVWRLIGAVLLGGFLGATVAAPVLAQALTAEPKILTKFSNGEPLVPTERRQLARIWHDEVLHIQANLSPLTEAETVALQTDYDAELEKNAGRQTKRSRATRATPAFKKRLVAQIVDENLKLLTILKSPTLAANREALVWTQLSANWLDRSFNTALVDLTQDNPPLRAAVFLSPNQAADGFIQARQRRGRFILIGMVIPHLAGAN